MPKPNIFKIATSELTQDSFLVWLIQWADPSCMSANENLNVCATAFIRMLLQLFGVPDNYRINKVVAGRQWENIDVWAEINDEYLLIIEDKIYSGEHSDQLIRYRRFAEEWCAANGFSLIPVYLKTGNESRDSFRKLESRSGFKVLSRKTLLQWLSQHQQVSSDIFSDFRDHLLELEESCNSFSSLSLKDWHSDSWVGFYQYLEQEIEITGWNRVNNPSGGFWCAVLAWPVWNGFPVHLQIEERKLCFKIGFHPDDTGLETSEFNANKVQDDWQLILLKAAEENGLTVIKKPYPYVHRGNYRTIAVVAQQDWLGNDDGMIDKTEVVGKLKYFIEFLNAVTAKANLNYHN